MNLEDRVRRRLETETPSLIDLSQTMHGQFELAYEEVRSAASLATALEEGGLNVERRVYGLETALRATAGHEGLHILDGGQHRHHPEGHRSASGGVRSPDPGFEPAPVGLWWQGRLPLRAIWPRRELDALYRECRPGNSASTPPGT